MYPQAWFKLFTAHSCLHIVDHIFGSMGKTPVRRAAQCTFRRLTHAHHGQQGFQRQGLTSREVRATSGEVWGTFGQVWETPGNPRIALKIHIERSSGDVAEELLGKFGAILSRSSGEPDSLPATRQNCLQTKLLQSTTFCKAVHFRLELQSWPRPEVTNVTARASAGIP